MQSILLTVMLTPFVALLLIPFFSTKYTLTDHQLQIDGGFSTEYIELADITYIIPTRSATSAAALSLDRLEINYQNKEILISPKDKPAFYRELKKRNPTIEIDDDRLMK